MNLVLIRNSKWENKVLKGKLRAGLYYGQVQAYACLPPASPPQLFHLLSRTIQTGRRH